MISSRRRLQLMVHGIGLSASLAIVVFAYCFWHQPMAEKIDANHLRIEQLQMMLTQGPKAKADMQALVTDLEQLDANLQSIKARIPNEPDDANFLNAINQQAKQLGLRIVDYRRCAVMERATHSEIEVNVKCLGDFSSLCQLLHYVESLPRQTAIRELVIHSLPEHAIYPMEITFILYFNLKSSAEQKA